MKREKYCHLVPRLVALLVTVSGLSSVAKDSNSIPLPLEAAVREAWTNNPEIRVLLSDIAAAQSEVTIVTTRQNPEISLTPGMDHTREPSDTQFHANFDLQQTFEWPGKRALRKAVAEKNVALRQLALDGSRSQLAIHVGRAYSILLAADEVEALREQRLDLAKSFVEAAKRRAEGGFAPDFEVTKAEVEVVTAQKAVGEAKAQQNAARMALNALMGRPANGPLEVSGSLTNIAELPERAALIQRALAQNPAIKVQEAEVERTGLSLKSIRKSRLPDFKVGPGVEYMPSEQIVGLGVSLPLPFWDKKKGEIGTATAEQAKALAELEKLKHEIEIEVAIASQYLIAARESLEFYTPALREKLRTALDAAEKGYSEGRTPLLLYLEAQRTYFDTQADYFETLERLHAAEADVQAAVGVPLDPLNPIPTKTN